MATANNSECYLIRGCELDSEHTNLLVPLGSTAARANYFLNNTRYPDKTHYTNLSYIRPEKGKIRVNGPITASDYNSNYVMFRNQSHENKWFYGFVNRVEYISDNAFEIIFDLDYENTYMEQLTLQASHIIRAHQDTDNFGDNLEYEPFNPIIKNIASYSIGGEKEENLYFIYAKKPPYSSSIVQNAVYCIDNLFYDQGGVQPAQGEVVVQGDHNNYMMNMANNSNVAYTITCRTGTYYFWKMSQVGSTNFLKEVYDYIIGGHVDDILAIGICPNVAKEWDDNEKAKSFVGCQVISNTNLSLPDNIDGYIPHNKKCLTGQFNRVSIEGDNVDTLYYELSKKPGNDIELTYAGTIQGGQPASFLTTKNYDQRSYSVTDHWDGPSEGVQTANTPGLRSQHRVTFLNYPTFGVVGSAFNQYWNFQTLTNAIRAKTGILGSGTNSMKTMNNNANSIKESMGGYIPKHYDKPTFSVAGAAIGFGADLVSGYQPTTAPTSGSSHPSVDMMTYTLGIKLILKQCIRNQIEKIDSFFDRYGYAINKVAIPNINARQYFTYIQLQDPDLEGDMPEEAKQAFKSTLTRGATFFNTNGRIGVYRPANQNTPNN